MAAGRMTNEDAALIESILREDAELSGTRYDTNWKKTEENNDTEWKTVSYPRRAKKQTANSPVTEGGGADGGDGEAFRQIDEVSEERHKRLVETQRAALAAAVADAGGSVGEDSGDDDGGFPGKGSSVSGGGDEKPKKPKVKKVKKVKGPKVSVAEAAAKIEADHLAAHLVEITGSYETQKDIQLMRFADYFRKAFLSVGSAQFPWINILKESTVAKMVDIPLSHVPEAVYKTSMDWLNRQPLEALASFALSLWDGILADLAIHQGPVKGSKKVAPQPSSKSQVALFVVLGLTLRRKPDVLISLLPIVKESQKYVGQDKLPVTVWMATQACQGDLAVGLYVWVQILLPMLKGKSANPQSRDLILQLVERILSTPKARQVLLNGAVRKGDRLVPPAALDTLMRLAFPSASSRIKATERFEAVYPTLKEVALAGSPGSKAMKQVVQQVMSFSIKAIGEGVTELCNEASDVFIWCLTENPESFKHWDNLYLDNIEASALVLKKLIDQKKLHSAKAPELKSVKSTLYSFKQKNEKAMTSKEYSDRVSSFKEADKHCRLLLNQLSPRSRILMVLALFAVIGAVLAMLYKLPHEQLDVVKSKFNLDELNRFLAKFNRQL